MRWSAGFQTGELRGILSQAGLETGAPEVAKKILGNRRLLPNMPP
jgi:hypothetical protein